MKVGEEVKEKEIKRVRKKDEEREREREINCCYIEFKYPVNELESHKR